MKRFVTFFSLLFFILLNIGCTSLEVKHLKNQEYTEVLSGPIYYLPTAKLDIVVKRQLKKCKTLAIYKTKDVSYVKNENQKFIETKKSYIKNKGIFVEYEELYGIAVKPEKIYTKNITGNYVELKPENPDYSSSFELDHPEVEINFSVTASVTPKFIPDLENPYLLDYEELDHPFKKTTLKLELYENGTIKSINGDISDRTGAITQNTVKGVIKIAKMVMGLPSLDAAAYLPIDTPPEFCNSETLNAITHYNSLTKRIKTLTKELPGYAPDKLPAMELELNKEKAKLKKYASHLTSETLYPSIPTFDTSSEWSKLLNVPTSGFLKWLNKDNIDIMPLVALKNEIKEIKQEEIRFRKQARGETNPETKKEYKQKADAKKQLEKEIINIFNDIANISAISPLSTELNNDITKLDTEEENLRNKADNEIDLEKKKKLEQQADALLQLKNETTRTNNVLNQIPDLKLIIKVAEKLNTKAIINISNNKISTSSAKSAKEESYFVYRQPSPAKLTICKYSSCAEKSNIILRKTYLLPQAGVYTTLPLENCIFDANVLTAQFGPSGNLISFDYITESQAEKASATFAEVAGASGTVVDAKREHDSELIKLKRDLEILTLQNGIKTETCKLDPDDILDLGLDFGLDLDCPPEEETE